MGALTADRNTAERTGDLISAGVTAAKECLAGGIAVLRLENIKPGVTGTGLICVGRFEEYVDNAAGLAGAVNATAKRGVFRFANSAAADEIAAAQIGDTCYIVDDQTVAKTDGTGTRSVAGIVADVDSAGVWVRMGFDSYVSPAAALLSTNNLSDLGTKATARANLGGGADKHILSIRDIDLVSANAEVKRVVSPVASPSRRSRPSMARWPAATGKTGRHRHRWPSPSPRPVPPRATWIPPRRPPRAPWPWAT